MNGEPPYTDAGKLDYSVVNRYWKKVKPSIMGPYMMDGFGFPASAGRFRFDAERVIVQQLIRTAKVDATGPSWIWEAASAIGPNTLRRNSSRSWPSKPAHRCMRAWCGVVPRTVISLPSMTTYCLLNPRADFHSFSSVGY